MKKLLLVLALTVGATQAPVGQEVLTEVNRIRRAPRDTRDWVNAFFPREIWEALWHENYDDLDSSYEAGWLVEVPNDPEGLGIEFQLEGDFPIAQAEDDPELKPKLFRLAKPAAGLLFYLAERMREEEQNRFRPFTLTSLCRTWEYQLRLVPVNPNANIEAQGVPPTHVFCLAFDITRANMTTRRDRLLLRILQQLRAEDKLIFFREGATQAAYHIIALLQAREQWEAEYDRLIQLATPTLTAAQQ